MPALAPDDRTQMILNTLVLSRDVMKKHADITGYDEKVYKVLYSDYPMRFHSDIEKYSNTISFDSYSKRCKSLAANSCKNFYYTDDGFAAEYENKYRKKT